jgi:hypothetical protein
MSQWWWSCWGRGGCNYVTYNVIQDKIVLTSQQRGLYRAVGDWRQSQIDTWGDRGGSKIVFLDGPFGMQKTFRFDIGDICLFTTTKQTNKADERVRGG